jgi:protein O-mannosyl-transferase
LSRKKKSKALPPSALPLKSPLAAASSRQRHLLAVGFMAAVTLFAYANTFHVPFLFDDEPNILKNASVQLKTLSLQGLNEVIRANYNESLRLFAYFTFALNYYFGGVQVLGYHLVNLLIHLGSGLALYGFLLLTFNLPSLRERYGSKAFPVALFSSLLFLCHPIQTQSVTYIVQRMTSLGGMFYLLAMLLYVKGRLASGARSYLYLTGMVLSYLLGLFTKENVAILPLFIALYEFYFFQNLEVSQKGKKALLYAAGFALGIGLLMVLVWGQRYVDVMIAGYKMRDFTLTERVLTQFRVVLYYVTLLVWPLPSRLNLDYDFSTSHGILDPPATLFAILMVAGLIGYAVWRAKKQPLVSYFILWYFGNLVIESSIFPLEMVYEHRLYLPLVGPVVLFVVFIAGIWEKLRTRITDTDTVVPLWVFFLVLSLLFALWAYERNRVWKNGFTLWEDCVKKSPGKYRPYYNLGLDYYSSGRYQDSIDVLRVANRLKPGDVQVLNNLGAAYRKMGRNQEAIGAYQEALRLNPGEPEAYNNLGLAYYHSGRYPEASDAFREAVRLKPGAEEFHYNLGVTCTALANPLSAIEAYQNAIRIKQDYAQARVNLALSYLMIRKPALALEQYRVLKDLDRERADKLLGLINSNK